MQDETFGAKLRPPLVHSSSFAPIQP